MILRKDERETREKEEEGEKGQEADGKSRSGIKKNAYLP